MTKKNNFVLYYRELDALIKTMTEKEIGQVMIGVFMFHQTGEIRETGNRVVDAKVYELTARIAESDQAYAAKCEKTSNTQKQNWKKIKEKEAANAGKPHPMKKRNHAANQERTEAAAVVNVDALTDDELEKMAGDPTRNDLEAAYRAAGEAVRQYSKDHPGASFSETRELTARLESAKAALDQYDKDHPKGEIVEPSEEYEKDLEGLRQMLKENAPKPGRK